MNEQQRERTEQQAINAAGDLAHDIDREIHVIIATLSGLATSPSLQDGNLVAFEAQSRSVAALIDTPILLRDPATGAQLMNTRLAAGEALPRLPTSDLDRAVVQMGQPFVSDVRIGQVTGRPLIAIAVPVMKAQKVAAILVASFDPSHLKPLLGAQSLGANWTTTILDRQGVVIGGSAPGAIMGLNAREWANSSKAGKVDRAIDSNGIPVLRAFKQTAAGWTTIATTPVASIETPVTNSWLVFFSAGAALLALALPATVHLSRRISAAITQTASTAAALERGEVVPLQVTGLREADDVLASMHATSIKLRERTRSLAESAARVKSTVEQAAFGVVQTDLDGHWVSVNRRFCDIIGYSEEECLALWPVSVTYPEDGLIEIQQLDAILRGTISSATYEKRFINKDDSIVWVRVTTSLVLSPDGYPTYYLSLVEDVTATQQATAARSKLAALVEAAGDAMISVSHGNIIEASNPSASILLGGDATQLIARPLLEFFPPHWTPQLETILAQAWHGLPVRIETVVKGQGSGTIAVLLSASPIRATGDVISGLAVTIENIQERKDWETQLLLLNRELQHRVKNSLAVVQSIANQTIRASKSLDAFRVAFDGRLQALAGAHDLLLQSAWTGDDLRSVIEKQVFPLLTDPARQIRLTGGTVTVPADLTVPISLALHELGTNALKYGALSRSAGRVELDCAVADVEDRRELTLTWREVGGPAPQQLGRQGFGSTLIKRGIRGARVEQTYAATGLVCTLTLVLHEVAGKPPSSLRASLPGNGT